MTGETMECPHCGHLTEADMPYCDHCGRSLVDADDQGEPDDDVRVMFADTDEDDE